MPTKPRLLSAVAVFSSLIAMTTASPAAHATSPGDLSGVISFLPGIPPANSLSLASVNSDGSGLHEWWPSGMPQAPFPKGGMTGVRAMAYSPDGSKLALVASAGTTSRLWIMAADGSDVHSIEYSNSTSVAWSADGKSIYTVQYSIDQGDNYLVATIVRMAADGSDPVPVVTVSGPNNPNIDSFKVSSKGDIAYDVRLSPSGKPSTYASYMFHAAGGQTTQFPSPISGYDFSPNGNSLMYPSNGGVCVQPVSGGACTQISSPNAPTEVAWSPDGTEYAYTSATHHLTIADLTGKTLSDVAPSYGVGGDLTWQPHAFHGAPAPIPTADRVAGADRFGTAINASRLQFADHSAKAAVLSRSDTYADALAGSTLAAAKHGPLLLTPTNSLDFDTVKELHRVLAPGATVYLLGGEKALSPGVEEALKAQGFTTKRLQGPDRYQTSVAIAKEITPHPSTIMVATGNNYPDALGAGAYAGARDGAVVLLSNDNVLTPQVKSYIMGWLANPVRPAMVAVGMQAGNAVGGLPVQAFSSWSEPGGSDRYETAAQLASIFGNTHQTVGLATGQSWPDALAGGAIAAAHNAPLLLSDGSVIPTREAQAISTLPYEAPDEILVFGGTNAVPAAAVTALEKATGRSGWVTQNNRITPSLP